MGSLSGSCEILESKDELSSMQSTGRFHQTRMQGRYQKPPLQKKGNNKSVADDINKLFEGIDLRATKSLDLSDRQGTGLSWKNASKKPMRVSGSLSPGIGFSEPVSLKQALRGLCVSQAAEAAMKLMSKPPGSPGLLEAGNGSSFHRSVIVDAGDSGSGRQGRFHVSLVPEESTSSYSFNVPKYILEPKSKSANHSAQSSPRFIVKSTGKSVESTLKQNEVVVVSTQLKRQSSPAQQGSHTSVPSLTCHEPKIRSGNYGAHSSPRLHQSAHSSPRLHQSAHSSPQLHQSTHSSPRLQQSAYSSPRLHQSAHSSPRLIVKPLTACAESTLEENKTLPASTRVDIEPETVQVPKQNHVSVPSVPSRYTDKHITDRGTKNPSKSASTSIRVVTKATPKLRRKGRLHGLQSASATKSNKDSKLIKSTSRAGKPAKSIGRKKEKHDAVSPSGDSNVSDEESRVVGSTSQSICHQCQCHLKDAKMESINNDPAPNPLSVSPAVSTLDRNTSKPGFVSNGCDSGAITPSKKFNKISKSREQLEFSHSSKSSIGEYSSSTTITEESNLSGPRSGNKPHMSKDSRWEAINNVRKQHGFLGLGHFNLLKKLGSGDIGTVYLSELIGTNCLFAIKVMDNEFLVRRRKMTRAQTEREILRMLDHPFLPTLYAQFTSDNLSCLVMEFCPGGDLHVLRQKQLGRYFPEQSARFYVAEVLLAMEYLHMLGIVYRDLKPENIMVREDGHIMLTDFDLSLRCSVSPTLLKSPLGVEPPRMSGPCAGSNCIDPFCAGPSCKVSCFTPRLRATSRARKLKAELAAQAKSLPQLVAEPTEARSNSFVGTHEYLAPEIIKGDGHGSAVDWWTLGIFLYELLYGKTPFKGTNNEDTLANVVLQSLKFPDSPMVSFQARDLIRGLLVKEPENRFGTETGAAEIKRHPFFEGLNWALIRCAIPPQVPEFSDVGVPKMAHTDDGKRYLEYSATGEHLEFDLF